MVDKIFKIGLLVLGFSYLAYLFCPISNQIGRYQYYADAGAIDEFSVFDTRTGLRYSYYQGVGGIKRDLIAWVKDDIIEKKGIENYKNVERIRKRR